MSVIRIIHFTILHSSQRSIGSGVLGVLQLRLNSPFYPVALAYDLSRRYLFLVDSCGVGSGSLEAVELDDNRLLRYQYPTLLQHEQKKLEEIRFAAIRK
ncbi:hypothetical protein TgHK011_000993 [Trichoderma gracile]|nr:hypothetical protein TgHK011_000993 [Trichoderma gracile]